MVVTGTASALLQMGKTRVYAVKTHVCSLLTLSFNNLWCMALNERPHFTHFVMLHDDVVPLDPGWLDTLLAAHRSGRADVTSCVVPIKDSRGLASTAFLHRPTNRLRRLTMTEAHKLPVTFGAAEAGYPDCALLPNTGLWVCDFTRPWVEKVCFTIRDRNFKGPDGKWTTQCFSEDWDFGVQLADLGLTAKATRAVNLIHKGHFDYPNMVAWGSLAEDDAVGIWTPPAVARLVPEPVYDRY